ncbi:SET domain-containing protein [Lophiostoma macrostomum CBS 122681]|uniref:SET domain-containing protein n=1 Tax=Lophiostoma macrostomum CBS 122681 TaxID=1314788 RepID=A0A6A6SIW9_9PLEO|nr:SET domain-containing protein [Lophiostoma macrostomum CBS 122681]
MAANQAPVPLLVPVGVIGFCHPGEMWRLTALHNLARQAANEVLQRQNWSHAQQILTPRRFVFSIPEVAEVRRLVRFMHSQFLCAVNPNDFNWPLKIQIPGNAQVRYGKEFDVKHILDANDWAGLPRPAQLAGPLTRWPPTRPEDILTVPRDSPEMCIGCNAQACKAETLMMEEYCEQLQPDQKIDFDSAEHGRVQGYVVAIDTRMQHLRVSSRRGGSRTLEIPFSSVRLSDNDWYDNVFTGTKPVDVQDQPCTCVELDRWREQQKDWHRRFEIRANGNLTDVFVVAVKPVKHNRPIGELIGILKPDHSVWGQQAPPTPRPQADLVRYRQRMIIGTRNQGPRGGPNQGDIECIVDNHKFCNWTQFIRHGCNPNAEWMASRYGDIRMIVLVSLRVIDAGEEIRVDHGYAWRIANGGCNCGAVDCRGTQP